MKYKAFTLVEVLTVLAIVGIITTIGINVFKNHDTNIRYLYSNVYNSLDKAIFNSANYTNLKDPFEVSDDVNESEGVKRLCLMLTEYINPAEASVSCDAGDNYVDPSNMGSFAAADAEIASKSPAFTSLNGVRFYISKRQEVKEESNDDSNDDEPKEENVLFRYYLVFADLNNSRAPNSMRYEPGRIDPDIYAFAILDAGRACPLGPPEIDDKYMLTRITYQVQNNTDNDEMSTLEFSQPSRPYCITKAEAWGYYLNNHDDNLYIEGNPYTYNDIIRKNTPAAGIYNGMDTMTNIITTFNKQYDPTSNTYISVRSGYSPDNRAYGCEKDSDEACDLIVDRYVY